MMVWVEFGGFPLIFNFPVHISQEEYLETIPCVRDYSGLDKVLLEYDTRLLFLGDFGHSPSSL